MLIKSKVFKQKKNVSLKLEVFLRYIVKIWVLYAWACYDKSNLITGKSIFILLLMCRNVYTTYDIFYYYIRYTKYTNMCKKKKKKRNESYLYRCQFYDWIYLIAIKIVLWVVLSSFISSVYILCLFFFAGSLFMSFIMKIHLPPLNVWIAANTIKFTYKIIQVDGKRLRIPTPSVSVWWWHISKNIYIILSQ